MRKHIPSVRNRKDDVSPAEKLANDIQQQNKILSNNSSGNGVEDNSISTFDFQDEDCILDNLERRFRDEYLVYMNETEAWMTIFPGCSYATANKKGKEFFNRPHVYEEIQAALNARSLRSQINADSLMKEIGRISSSDIHELFDKKTGLLINPHNMPMDIRRCVASVKVLRTKVRNSGKGERKQTITESIVEYKLWNKMDAIKELVKILNLDAGISPLEALLAALPEAISDQLRQVLAEGEDTAKQPRILVQNSTVEP